MEEGVPSFFRFEDLRVYGKAIDYCRWLHVAMRESRSECERELVDKFAKAAMDIALNIAEGSSRNKNQFETYLKTSKASIRECVVYTTIAKNVGMLNDESAEQSRGYLMELTRMIGALIISLQRSQRKTSFDMASSSEPESESDFDIKIDDGQGSDFMI